MRTGAYTVHQTLTPEAASVLKQSLTLARRRGHSQVTPLHVASTLLTSTRSNLFRKACLKSHPFTTFGRQISHPSLHCRALELCFNVALNRLPTNPNPLFQTQPSLSNALVAALKRAQAHQRRGCVEQQSQQNQPFLAVKVELEQLIVSILDDPSVSRVMREAGLSSVAVKSNIEDDSPVNFYGSSSSVGVFSSPCSPSSSENNNGGNLSPKIWQHNHHSFEQNPFFHFPKGRVFNQDNQRFLAKEDANPVIEILLGMKNNKRKNTIIVGDSLSLTEGVIAKLVNQIERGEVPDDLKQTQFIKFQFSQVGLNFMKKEDIERQVKELRRKVDSFTSWGGKGVIVCLGDLNWTVWNNENSENGSNYYAGDHLVEEIGRFVYDYSTSRSKVWILGSASYQTYMRCQMKQPPLDVQWSLQAVSIPSGELSLTLHPSSSEMAAQVMELKPFGVKEEEEEEEDRLNFCGECAFNYEKEAKAFISNQHKILPPWLQSNGDNNKNTQKFQDELNGLKRKWNRFCQALHHSKTNWRVEQRSSVLPNSAAISVNQSFRGSSSVAKFRRQNSCTIEFSFGSNQDEVLKKNLRDELSLDGFKSCNDDQDIETKITLALGPSPLPSDLENSDEEESEKAMKLKGLKEKLQENLPWQNEVFSSIMEVMENSMKKRRKRDTWMVISGNDFIAKRRLALTITTSLFGSTEKMSKINLKKRMRGSQSKEACEELEKALKDCEKVVVLIERIDLADARFIKLLVDRFEDRKFKPFDDFEGKKNQMIFLLTKEDDDCENIEDFVIPMALKCRKLNSLSINNKRKAEFDDAKTAIKTKNFRIEEEDKENVIACDISNIKKKFSRQLKFSSSTTLDLNLKVDMNDDEEEEDKLIDIEIDEIPEHSFLDSIQNQFDFTVLSNEEITHFFVTEIKDVCEAILGDQKERFKFTVDAELIGKFYDGFGFLSNGLFEEWLKEVFEKSLVTVKKGGKEGINVINLSLKGIEEINEGLKVYEEGFKGTCLPNTIQVSFVD